MPATSTLTRTPPARKFENYTLTHTVDASAGLSSVSDTVMLPLPGPGETNGYTISQGGGWNCFSYVHPIGFDFQIDGIKYSHFVASSNGWLVLVDPALGTFSTTQVMSDATGASNASILATFTSNAVLVAPWFDSMKNIVDDPSKLTLFVLEDYRQAKIDRIRAGLEPSLSIIDTFTPGVWHFNDDRSAQGRRLIVRWKCLSSYLVVDATAIINFEAVLYENGTIEFRYAPSKWLGYKSNISGATIGIFMPNGTNRFRDMSAGLGYLQERKEYVYGGFTYDPSFSDSGRPYVVNLQPYGNWPGSPLGGGTFAFSPPVNRRRVLPRELVRRQDAALSLPTVTRTGDSRLGNDPSAFDDRRTPTYGTSVPTIVNYPSTLPRFFGGTSIGVQQRQDLFSNDFLVTSSIVKGAFDQFMNDRPITTISAFNESNRHEQDPSSTSRFFVTGSDSTFVESGFEQGLKSKTQVRFSLRVHTGVTMPDITSSIYYYNSSTKAWEVPLNSSYVTDNHGNKLVPNPFAEGDMTDAVADGVENRIVEDVKCFGPIGNLVSSGTIDRYGGGAQVQTDDQIGTGYYPEALGYAIGKSYAKSARNNEEYRATPDETFTIPITSPFLIEKAIIEVPFAAGPGWFNDMTQCFIPGNSATGEGANPAATAFDFAGPALTIALFRQVQLAENASGPTLRDLILTGTITHANDNVSSVVLSNFPPLDSTYQVRPVGFLSYANPPSAVVTPSSTGYFTGSVTLQTEALSAAGVIVKYVTNFTTAPGAAATDLKGFLTKVPKLKLLSVGTLGAVNGNPKVNVAYVSPLGRGGTGFQQAGRCILGNEYVTTQGLSDPSGMTAANPLYTPKLSAQIAAALAATGAGNVANANVSAAIPMISHFPSPYLVMPGDRLILSISKMRPTLYQPHDADGTATYVTAFSSSTQHPSAGHDVNLLPGTINVTLYGSQVRAGVEFHDTMNQPLASNAMHEVIGTDPVLDQFEVAYRNEYSGSFTDNIIVPNDVVGSGWTYLISALGANTVPPLTTNPWAFAAARVSQMKSYRLQPWWERAGDVRLSQFFNSSERFYDSMMPALDQCFNADGCGIFVIAQGTFGDVNKIDTPNPNRDPLGWIWMDVTETALSLISSNPASTANYQSLIEPNWSKAFPFEPRYSAASRQLSISKGLIANYEYDATVTNNVKINSIPPRTVSGLMFGTVAAETVVATTPELAYAYYFGLGYDWLSDVNVYQSKTSGEGTFHVTGSMTTDDLSRGLYGFGDRNTYCYRPAQTRNWALSAGNNLLGTGHFPHTRDHEGPSLAYPGTSYPGNDYFRFSPVIRGWKYGVYSGIPTFSKCYWRRGKFGQFRDMLEQRPNAKYYESPENGPVDPNFQQCLKNAVVRVKFVSPDGKTTDPLNTWTSNLSFECTSSLPFFDGVSTNRPVVNVATLDQRIIAFNQDRFGNLSL